MARVMIGLFDDRGSAEQAVIELKAAGFDPDRMGFVMRDQQEARQAADDVGGAHTGVGAATGGILGAGLGAILAATGAFVIPGIGPFVSAGILATAIVGGAAGALVGALVGLGIPREEAEYYNRRVEEGSALVTLDPEGREAEARTILLHHGAEDTWRTTPWALQPGAPGTTGAIQRGQGSSEHPQRYDTAAGPMDPRSPEADQDRRRALLDESDRTTRNRAYDDQDNTLEGGPPA